MSYIKHIPDKGAVVAWSPLRGANRSTLLAVATKEGGGGGFDEYGGELSVYHADTSSYSYDCNLVSRYVQPSDEKEQCRWAKLHTFTDDCGSEVRHLV